MKVYTEAETEALHETVIKKHSFHPFWVFADITNEEGGTPIYWCFLNTHYPAGLVALEKDAYNKAVDDLTSGRWLLSQKANASNKDLKIGFGYDETPSKAFIEACRMAGVIKKEGS